MMDRVTVLLFMVGVLMLILDMVLIAIIVVGVALVWFLIESNWLSVRLVVGKTKKVVRKKRP